jgi:solute carrier family 50 protein (sugar transporter)
MVSVWLNLGASKLQYYQLRQTQYDDWDAHHSEENLLEAHDSISIAPSDNLTTRTDAIPKKQDFIFVSQETLLLRILFTWITIVVAVGWLGLVQNRAAAIGILVNVNLIFFYGAPLQTIRTVLQTQSSDSIHRPTMMMNFLNTLFWLLYGIARHDIYIFGPNAIGLILGILQATLCCYYSSTTTNGSVSESDNQEPLLPQDEISPEGIG